MKPASPGITPRRRTQFLVDHPALSCDPPARRFDGLSSDLPNGSSDALGIRVWPLSTSVPRSTYNVGCAVGISDSLAMAAARLWVGCWGGVCGDADRSARRRNLQRPAIPLKWVVGSTALREAGQASYTSTVLKTSRLPRGGPVRFGLEDSGAARAR